MRSTILVQINLSGTNLSGVDLSDKDLTGANLSRAYLNEADLRGANLTGSSMTRIILVRTPLSDATLGLIQLAKIYRCSTEIPDKEAKLWIKIIRRIYEWYGNGGECSSKWGKSD